MGALKEEIIWIPKPRQRVTRRYAMESELSSRFNVMHGANMVGGPVYVRSKQSCVWEAARTQPAAVIPGANLPKLALVPPTSSAVNVSMYGPPDAMVRYMVQLDLSWVPSVGATGGVPLNWEAKYTSLVTV